MTSAMKKSYIQPLTAITKTAAQPFICASKGVHSERGIDYAGVDENGEKIPGSRRRRRNQWDDEELEDEEAW